MTPTLLLAYCGRPLPEFPETVCGKPVGHGPPCGRWVPTPIPSLAEARVERNAALDVVELGASDDWKDAAYAFLTEYLRAHDEMFVDDLWAAGLPQTREDRALGAVFQRAVRAGLMRKSGRFRASVRSHATEKPVWESLCSGAQRAEAS